MDSAELGRSAISESGLYVGVHEMAQQSLIHGISDMTAHRKVDLSMSRSTELTEDVKCSCPEIFCAVLLGKLHIQLCL
jgi:hypothetical protein